jgi:cardiolipin synthase
MSDGRRGASQKGLKNMRRLFAILVVFLTLLPSARATAAAGQLQLVVEPNDGVAPLVSLINSARHTIDGEVYLASSKPVLGALEVAAARHVTVRINLEQHPYGTGSAAPQLVYRTLAAHGVQMRWTSSSYRFTHAKYLVVDAIRAWIGTPII